MQRRELIGLLAAASAWPLAARAQRASMPVVGFLYSASGGPDSERPKAFRSGLAEAGFIAGENVAIEYRFAEGRYERLPALAAELVARPVAVIAASGVTATSAAKAATATIPIVFNTGADPVRLGLVSNLAKPQGNLTGVTTLGKVLIAKQLELLDELLPAGARLAFLINPNNAVAGEEGQSAKEAAKALGRELAIIEAANEPAIDAAFVTVAQHRAGAMLMQSDPFFSSKLETLAAQSLRHAMPTLSPYLNFAAAGGLFSYGSSVPDALRLVGVYAGRILKGERPADLPVQQAVKVQLIVNLRTAKVLGLTLPPAILLRADRVIE